MEASARRSGWVGLVGLLFLLSGGFNLLWGVAALGVSLGGTDPQVIGDLSTGNLEGLGIAGVVVGTLQALAGIGILNRSRGALTLGLVLAGFSVLLNFGYHRVLEGWAFSGLVLNLAILVILSLRAAEFD